MPSRCAMAGRALSQTFALIYSVTVRAGSCLTRHVWPLAALRRLPAAGMARGERASLLSPVGAVDLDKLVSSALSRPGCRQCLRMGSHTDQRGTLSRRRAPGPRTRVPGLAARAQGDGEDRTVLMAPVARSIEAYLAGRDSGPIFVTKVGRRMDQPEAWRMIRRIARRAELVFQAGHAHLAETRISISTLCPAEAATSAGGTPEWRSPQTRPSWRASSVPGSAEKSC